MMDNPMVSIIIPVYNGSNYLREAIDSALLQGYNNYEIIVINDGSKDNGKTEEIALSYGDKIRYYYKENGGVATALNYGISKMKGEYFSWLSHDDIYYPNKLSAQIEALKMNGNMKALVFSNYDIWDMSSNIISTSHFEDSYSIEQLTNSVFPVMQWLTLSSTPLIHKSHFNRVGLFDEGLKSAQDNDMWFRLFRNEVSVFEPKSLMKSRQHKESGTNTMIGFNEELGKVAIKSMLDLSDREIKSVFGHPALLYHRIAFILRDYNIPHYYKIALNKLHETEIPPNLLENLYNFNEYIHEISKKSTNKICIFCVGQYGKRLYHELNSRLVYVDFFSDNNPDVWGKIIEGRLCIEPSNLKKMKKDTLIIVAAQIPDGIIEQLKMEGFPYITTKQQLEQKLSKTVPLKWITALDEVENISDEMQLIKTNLKQTIFDTCKYYSTRKRDKVVQ